MPYRRKPTLDVRKLLLALRAGCSDRQVVRDLGLSRHTVSRYRQWAGENELLQGDMPETGQLQQMLDKTLPVQMPPQNHSSVEPFKEMVRQLRDQGVEVQAIHSRLCERGYHGSYSSVYRYIRALEPRSPDITLRVETDPGYEAQVDFGEVGRLIDSETGQLRKAYVFVMTLSFSRYTYAEVVFDQKTSTWLDLHMHAFAFFAGVPARVVLDNLKAGITKASFHDPVVNRAYGEMAEHYGFLLAPCRPATPQHKGKVENSVHYVQRNFFAGREPSTLQRTNSLLLDWCKKVAEREHGKTRKRPIDQYNHCERALLKPLPCEPFDLPVFAECKLHRDCYVTFQGSYYSAPFRLVGQSLWVRAGLKDVRIYDQAHQLVATHELAREPGTRQTHSNHLPENKTAGLPRSPRVLKEQAAGIGESALAVVEQILADPVVDRTAAASRVLSLQRRYSSKDLELACKRALHFDTVTFPSVRNILKEGLQNEPLSPPASAPAAGKYVRSAQEIFGRLLGGFLC